MSQATGTIGAVAESDKYAPPLPSAPPYSSMLYPSLPAPGLAPCYYPELRERPVFTADPPDAPLLRYASPPPTPAPVAAPTVPSASAAPTTATPSIYAPWINALGRIGAGVTALARSSPSTALAPPAAPTAPTLIKDVEAAVRRGAPASELSLHDCRAVPIAAWMDRMQCANANANSDINVPRDLAALGISWGDLLAAGATRLHVRRLGAASLARYLGLSLALLEPLLDRRSAIEQLQFHVFIRL